MSLTRQQAAALDRESPVVLFRLVGANGKAPREASFHEIVAIQYFGADIETVECATFPKLFSVMENGQAEYAVCAIENSLAGSILPNYAHLRNSNLEIIGEVYLRIEMNLMALPNQSIDQIEEIHSHPMALLQCQGF